MTRSSIIIPIYIFIVALAIVFVYTVVKVIGMLI